MKRLSAVIATTTVALILTSFTYGLPTLVNSTTTDTETGWHLTVTGFVETPLSLNWTEIVAMPKTTVYAKLFCVDFPNTVVTQGNWTGVELQTLLDEAKPSADAIKLAFHAADGYSTDLALETAMHRDVILAYEQNGVSLEYLRLVVPGKWGYKWISQLISIELVNYNFLGFWESRGYSDEASITSGGQGAETPNFPVSPTVPPSNTSAPSSSPSPTTSPAPSDEPTLNPESPKGLSVPPEAVYAIAALAISVVSVTVLAFVRKKTRKG